MLCAVDGECIQNEVTYCDVVASLACVSNDVKDAIIKAVIKLLAENYVEVYVVTSTGNKWKC